MKILIWGFIYYECTKEFPKICIPDLNKFTSVKEHFMKNLNVNFDTLLVNMDPRNNHFHNSWSKFAYHI